MNYLPKRTTPYRAFIQLLLLLTAVLPVSLVNAQQFAFEYDTTIPFVKGTDTLHNSWAGGINAGQYSKLLLNDDSIEDLVVFDRTTNKIHTFVALAQGNTYRYQYAPKYELQFPEDLQEWVLLVDYNRDGKKDLFTHGLLGVKVYQNVSTQTSLVWKPSADPLKTQTLSAMINLQVYVTDIPAITDVDNDGDIDILMFDSQGNSIEFHENQGIQQYNVADSLVFKKVNSCWGKFRQGEECGEYIFNIDCGSSTGRVKSLRINHQASSTVLITDLDGDGDKDLLNGHMGCNAIARLTNQGNNTQASFTEATPLYPAGKPIRFPEFPAVFYEDLDFDGIKDLIASPNTAINYVDSINFSASNWLYKNTGTTESPVFAFQQPDFLQSTMIDVGEDAFPAFADYDGDKDADLFIGNRRNYTDKGTFYATIYVYENIGTPQNASYKLVTEDYLNLSSLQLRAAKPAFADINGDGAVDFLFTNTNTLRYILNSASKDQAFQFSSAAARSLPLPLFEDDTPLLYDFDGDTDLDALVGKASGNLEYYINTGSLASPAYTLKSNSITTIPNEPFNNNITACIADWDKDGKADLITGDKTGSIKMYPAIVDKLQTSSIQLERADIFWQLAAQTTTKTFLKGLVFPAAADLTGDNYPELVIGTQAGGITLWKNKANPDPNGIEDEMENAGMIYPNPTNRYLYLQLPTESEVSLFTLLGQPLAVREHIQANQPATLDLHTLPPGVYILKMATGQYTYTRKIILYH